MTIKEISKETFDYFAKSHLLANQYQTSNYAEVKRKLNYEVIYIGAYKNNELIGSSMILSKLIAPTIKYGYAPRGFLVDYYNKEVFTEFTKALKSYFLLKNYAFIKLDPEIILSTVNKDTKTKEINAANENLIGFLSTLGYKKLKSTLYFDSMMPIYNPVLSLTNFNLLNMSEKDIINIRKSDNLGLSFRVGEEKDIKEFYEFIKDKKNRTSAYYEEYYRSFKKDDAMDLVLIELDYTIYLKLLQEAYKIEEDNNIILNNRFIENHNDVDLLNEKMESDKNLSSIKNEIIAITKVVKDNKKYIIAGAFITKFNNRISIVINGHDKNYPLLNSKLYLFYNIIMHYKALDYEYLDMNGITADFNENNPYKSLNDFKLKFKPTIYEYIGEFDLVINPAFYQMLWSTGKLNKEFQKERVSN